MACHDLLAAAGTSGLVQGCLRQLQHAFTLADLLAVAADHHDLARRFDAAVGPDLRCRYRAVADEDRATCAFDNCWLVVRSSRLSMLLT